MHVEPSLSNDAVLSNWLHLYRAVRRPMVVALEPIELVHFDASSPRDREALVTAVSLALDTLRESPEIVMRVDGPFFLVGFSINELNHASSLVRDVLTASTTAVRTTTRRPVRPAVSVQLPTPMTSLADVTEHAVTELIAVRAQVHQDLVSA